MPNFPETAPFDVIVVLGAAQRQDGSPGPAMERRVRYGVKCLLEGRGNYLMLSGGVTTADVSECETMASLATELGAKPGEIIHENRASRTLENAAYCAKILRHKKLSRCLLVTDGFHMPRALMTFRAFGIQVEPAPVSASWSLYTVASYVRELVARQVYPKRIKAYLEIFPENSNERE